LLADLRQAQVRVSPDLRFTVIDKELALDGTLAIPTARVELATPGGALTPSADVIVADPAATAAERARAWSVRADVRVALGELVRVSGYGFSGLVGGQVRITDEPEAATRAQGELVIRDGRYRAYGQDLSIEQGRLLYAGGPIDDPGIDARAQRRVGEIVAGIRVGGTLRLPTFTLYSTPPMSETDTLAYLVLGHPLPEASKEEGRNLAAVALGLRMAGADAVAQEIGARFGLDEVAVQSTGEGEQAALVIGRYLTPRLYMSYSLGLFEQVNMLRIRYQVGRRWALEAESGVESAADLIYTIER
jgi:translocation and assembly module TamB